MAVAGGGIENGRRRGERVRDGPPVILLLGHDDIVVESLGWSGVWCLLGGGCALSQGIMVFCFDFVYGSDGEHL